MIFRYSLLLVSLVPSLSHILICEASQSSEKKRSAQAALETPEAAAETSKKKRKMRRTNSELNSQFAQACLSDLSDDPNARNRQIEHIRELLRRGANPYIQCYMKEDGTYDTFVPQYRGQMRLSSRPLLTHLCMKNALLIVSELFDFSDDEEGFSFECIDELCEVAKRGYLELCKLLLERGDNEYNNINNNSSFGDTPLHLAALNGHHLICRELILNGADVNLPTLRCDREQAAKATGTGCTGMTALQIAACCGHMEVCHELIQRRGTRECADVNIASKSGYTALHFAAGRGYRDICEYLIGAGARINARATRSKWTPLYWAVIANQVSVVKLFLEDLAEEDQPQGDDLLVNGESLLFGYAVSGDNDIVGDLLIKKGCRLDVHEATHGGTVLHFAALNGNSLTTGLFLKHKAPVDALDEEGQSPLHWGAHDGSNAVCTLLLDAGALVNLQCETGYTPLHFAVESGNSDVCRTLINRGASVVITNEKGDSPLSQAFESGDQELVELLLGAIKDLSLRENLRSLRGRAPAASIRSSSSTTLSNSLPERSQALVVSHVASLEEDNQYTTPVRPERVITSPNLSQNQRAESSRVASTSTSSTRMTLADAITKGDIFLVRQILNNQDYSLSQQELNDGVILSRALGNVAIEKCIIMRGGVSQDVVQKGTPDVLRNRLKRMREFIAFDTEE